MSASGHLRRAGPPPGSASCWRAVRQPSRSLHSDARRGATSDSLIFRYGRQGTRLSGQFLSPVQVHGGKTPPSLSLIDHSAVRSSIRQVSVSPSCSSFALPSSFSRSPSSSCPSLSPELEQPSCRQRLPFRPGRFSVFLDVASRPLSHAATPHASVLRQPPFPAAPEPASSLGPGETSELSAFREGPPFSFPGKRQPAGLPDTQDGAAEERKEREVYGAILERYRALLYAIPHVGASEQKDAHAHEEEGLGDGTRPEAVGHGLWGKKANRQNVIEFLVASEEGLRLCDTKGFVDIATLPVLRLPLPPPLLSHFVRALVEVALDSPSLRPLRTCVEKLVSDGENHADQSEPPAACSPSSSPSFPSVTASLSPSQSEELRLACSQVEQAWGLPRLVNFYIIVCTLDRRGVLRDVPGGSKLRNMATLGLLSTLKNGDGERLPVSPAQLLQALSSTPQGKGDCHTTALERALQGAIARRLIDEYSAPTDESFERQEHLVSRLQFLSRTLRAVLARQALHSSLLPALEQSLTGVVRQLETEHTRLRRRLAGDAKAQETAPSLSALVACHAALLPSLADCVVASELLQQRLSASTKTEASGVDAKQKTELFSGRGELNGHSRTVRRGGDSGRVREAHENLRRSFVALQTQVFQAARQAVEEDAQLGHNGFTQQLVRYLKEPLRAAVYLQQNARKMEMMNGNAVSHRPLDVEFTRGQHDNLSRKHTESPLVGSRIRRTRVDESAAGEGNAWKRTESLLDALGGPLVEFLECLYTSATVRAATPVGKGHTGFERTSMPCRAEGTSASRAEPQPKWTPASSSFSETPAETAQEAAAPSRVQTAYPHVPPNSPFALLATTSRLPEAQAVASSTPQAEGGASLQAAPSPFTSYLGAGGTSHALGNGESVRPELAVDGREAAGRRGLLDELQDEGGVLQLASVFLRQSDADCGKLYDVLLPLLPELPKPCLLQLLKILSQVGLLPTLSVESPPPPISAAPAATPVVTASPASFLAAQLAARLVREPSKKAEEQTSWSEGEKSPAKSRERSTNESNASLNRGESVANPEVGEELQPGVGTPGACAHASDARGDSGGCLSQENGAANPPCHPDGSRPMPLFDAIVAELERRRRCAGNLSGNSRRQGAPPEGEEDWMSVGDLLLLSACYGTKEIAKEVRNPSSLVFFSDSLPSLAAARLQSLVQEAREEKDKTPGEQAALLVARVTQAVEAVHRHSACMPHAASPAKPSLDPCTERPSPSAAASDSRPDATAFASSPFSPSRGLASMEMSRFFEVAANVCSPLVVNLPAASLGLLLGALSRGTFSHTQELKTAGAGLPGRESWAESTEQTEDALRMWKAHAEVHNGVAKSLLQRHMVPMLTSGQARLFLLSFLGLLQLRDGLVSPVGRAASEKPLGEVPVFASAFLQDAHAAELWRDTQETFEAMFRQILAALGSQVRSASAASDDDIAETLHLINAISRLSPRAADLLDTVGLPLGPPATSATGRSRLHSGGGSLGPSVSLRERRERLKAFFQSPGQLDERRAAGASVSGGFLSRWLGRGW
ncbi:conserved hypothetical protein [Neospora caninum Liverpool]|uniref:Uncharacterized protein n=1 Tax=Neospora caninum (strain Liverpool) TaxID=572307 RepID=F0VNI3_NEOCL|nr:conserved hypothetical protein [Neospora caninum Liverpool]CBZ55279.1 conserved hypothetical protein [Neospora caninum Liverpool]|eukprot:XP_003885307.1 conserved hypothetical protein [Neospora caninum Liverpool]